MTTIRIVADMLLNPGACKELMPTFQTLVSGSRKEAGNQEYDLTVSLDNPDHLFVIETWASEEAIAFHNDTPHFQSFVKALDGRVKNLSIHKVKKLL